MMDQKQEENNEDGISWGRFSFYLSLISVVLIFFYWLLIFIKAPLWYVYISIIMIILGGSILIILGTGIIILLGGFSFLKDKWYALAGFVISVITFTYTIYYFFLI